MALKLLKSLSLIKLNFGQSFFLGLILVLFILTRIAFLGSTPPSAYWDEASIGYNAFSVATDLKDEWGDMVPLHFRAFGEFKLPVYVYSVVPFVKVLGLNEFSVRVPAMLYSLGTIFLVYLLATRFTKNGWISLLAPMYLAVSPWFFIFSLTGYEATAGVFFALLGILFFLSYKKSNVFILLSVFAYILAIYSYNSFRIVIPIILILQSAFLFKEKAPKKYLLASLGIFALAFVPIIRLTLGEGSMRFGAVGETRLALVIENFLSHFSPEFLLAGDVNVRSTMPGFGVIWFTDFLLIPIGLLALLTKKNWYSAFLVLVFFLSFVPSAITTEAPHALRSLFVVPLLALIWTGGVENSLIRFKKYSKYIAGVISVVMLFGFGMYLQEFSNSYNNKYSEHWQYAYKKLFTDYKGEFGKYRNVVITDEYAQPYIFGLFYTKVDPNSFRSTVDYNSPDKWGVSLVAGYNNIIFREATNADLVREVLVFSSKKLDQEPDEVVTFLNGEEAIFVYKN